MPPAASCHAHALARMIAVSRQRERTMSEQFDVQRHVLGPLLTYGLWSWSHHVFRPALVAKSLGLYKPNTLGTPPGPHKLAGGGPDLSTRHDEPVLLAVTPGHYDSVVEFDHCSD